MQTALIQNFVIGTFIKELKNRFLCEVNINDENVVCYVPSSCHLSNFLQLEGKQVLLIPTLSQNSRTQYSVFAIRHKKSYIILNSSIANKAILNNITNRRFAYLSKRKCISKEYTINQYKADVFIHDTNSIIEIKSVISLDTNAVFPTVYSERALNQLKQLGQLLQEGFKVYLFIVALNPYVKKICLNKNTEFNTELRKCVDNGMLIKAYSCKLSDKKLIINKELYVEFDESDIV